ncbi:MAG: hypothetical protein OCD02_15815 [Spirochaetaceae bacterium]
MSNKEKEVIEKLLKLYPDVIEFLGGEKAVSSDAILERISKYINKHKWFVNENIPYTITLEQAFFSWHENVFLPQSFEMVRTKIEKTLDHLDKFDIFKMVSDEYYYLSEKDKSTYYNKACYSIIARESKSFFSRKYAQLNFKKHY